MRVAFIALVLSDIAFISNSRGTRFGMAACRAGMLKENATPDATDRMSRCQYSMTPLTISTVLAKLSASTATCAQIISARRSTRSATTPPIGAMTSMGSATPSITMESAILLPVMS